MATNTRWISDGLTPASAEKARVELNETEEARETGLAALREKMREHCVENEGFTFVKDTDKFLIAFLRARKYDVDRAFKLLLNYTRFRSKHADLVEGTTFETVKPILEARVACFFGDRDSQGRRMLMFQPAKLDTSTHEMKDGLRTLIYVLDRVIEDEETQVNGFVAVQNFEGMTLSRVLMFDRTRTSIAMELFQDAFPARFKGFHIVNNSAVFSILWAIARPFMKEKMRQRYHMHGSDRESLFSAIPKADVPAEVDGDRPAYDPQDLIGFLSSLQSS